MIRGFWLFALAPLVLVGSILGSACAGAPAAEPNTPLQIRLIHGVPIATIMALMYEVREKPGLLPNYGKEYTIENRRVDAAAEVTTVMAAGEGDIGYTGTGPLINANTKLDAKLRVVGDQTQGGVEGHEGLRFLVRDDGPQTIPELKGRTIATLSFGTTADLAMRVGMRKAGLDPDKDVTFVQVPFGAMEANLRERKVDMAQFVQPFYSIADSKGGLRQLFSATDAVGPTQQLVLIAREGWLKQNPRRAQAFFDDYYRFIQWVLDPANADEARTIGARMADQNPAAFGFFGSKNDWYRSKDALPNVQSMKNDVKVLKEFGVIESEPNIDPWIDLSWMQKAAQNARR